jgi:hypothetical protein
MDERMMMWVMVGISAIILVAIGPAITLIEGLTIWTAVMLGIIAALVLMALFLVVRTAREMRSGLPLQDERSISLAMKAGNRAFHVSTYLVLFMAMGFTLVEEPGIAFSNAELLFVVVALMGSVHLIPSAYCNRRGRRASE